MCICRSALLKTHEICGQHNLCTIEFGWACSTVLTHLKMLSTHHTGSNWHPFGHVWPTFGGFICRVIGNRVDMHGRSRKHKLPDFAPLYKFMSCMSDIVMTFLKAISAALLSQKQLKKLKLRNGRREIQRGCGVSCSCAIQLVAFGIQPCLWFMTHLWEVCLGAAEANKEYFDILWLSLTCRVEMEGSCFHNFQSDICSVWAHFGDYERTTIVWP